MDGGFYKSRKYPVFSISMATPLSGTSFKDFREL
jgi:hypothetical protein